MKHAGYSGSAIWRHAMRRAEIEQALANQFDHARIRLCHPHHLKPVMLLLIGQCGLGGTGSFFATGSLAGCFIRPAYRTIRSSFLLPVRQFPHKPCPFTSPDYPSQTSSFLLKTMPRVDHKACGNGRVMQQSPARIVKKFLLYPCQAALPGASSGCIERKATHSRFQTFIVAMATESFVVSASEKNDLINS